MIKSIFTTFFATLAFLLISQQAVSQEGMCESGYLPFKKGLVLEMTGYDKKGKLSSSTTQKITNLESIGDGFRADSEMEIRDKKGKLVSSGSYAIECRGDVMTIDVSAMLDPRTMESFSNMEMEINSEELQIPNTLRPGQTLPDGKLTAKVKSGGLSLMSLSIQVKNRQVGERETITTPAGTFDCIRISDETEVKSIAKVTTRSTTWYAKGVGTVKTENYDKKGNMESYTLLTKIER